MKDVNKRNEGTEVRKEGRMDSSKGKHFSETYPHLGKYLNHIPYFSRLPWKSGYQFGKHSNS